MYSRQLDSTYFESEEFAVYFMENLRQEMRSLIYSDSNSVTYTIEEDGTRIYYNRYLTRQFLGLKNSSYVIIYHPRNKIYTNIGYALEEVNLEQMVKYIEIQKGTKIHIQNGQIKTDSNAMKEEWERYKDWFSGTYYYTEPLDVNDKEQSVIDSITLQIEEQKKKIELGEERNETTNWNMTESEKTDENLLDANMDDSGKIYVDYDVNDFEIFINYEEEFASDAFDKYMLNLMKMLQKYEDALYVAVPISGIFIAIIIVYLIMAIGHKKDKEEIELNDIDKIPVEIVIRYINDDDYYSFSGNSRI